MFEKYHCGEDRGEIQIDVFLLCASNMCAEPELSLFLHEDFAAWIWVFRRFRDSDGHLHKGSRQERLIIDVQLDYHNNRVYSLCKMLRITMTPSTSSTRQQGSLQRQRAIGCQDLSVSGQMVQEV